MRLNSICGNTYIIDGPTQIGVYCFDDKTCLLIDSGPADQTEPLLKLIEEQGYRARVIINTHAHADHCGGNRKFQLHHQSEVYASELSTPFIQYPALQSVALFSASPPRILQNKFIMPPASKVDKIISPGSLPVNDKAFRIIALEGHAIGQIGIETPDGVLFAGDSLLPLEVLAEFPFHYLFDVEKYIETLTIIKRENHPQLFLSHGGRPENLQEVIEANQAMLERILQLIIWFLTEARTREEIVAFMITSQKLPFNQSQYYLLHASISACLSYLEATKKIRSFATGDAVKHQARI